MFKYEKTFFLLALVSFLGIATFSNPSAFSSSDRVFVKIMKDGTAITHIETNSTTGSNTFSATDTDTFSNIDSMTDTFTITDTDGGFYTHTYTITDTDSISGTDTNSSTQTDTCGCGSGEHGCGSCH